MTFTEFVFYQLIFLFLGAGLLYYIKSSVDYNKSQYLLKTRKIVALGFIGWLIAFLRIIIIQVYQVTLLLAEGVDITDLDAVSSAPITSTYRFVLIGPLLSGLFEEGIRFWLLMKVIGIGDNRIDRKYIPLIFGYSWAYSEILILTLPLAGSGVVGLAALAVGILERLMATLVHICFTYMILYGRFISKRTTVGLAMILHTLYNLTITILAMELGTTTFSTIMIIEMAIVAMTLLIVWFTKGYRERKESWMLSFQVLRQENNQSSIYT